MKNILESKKVHAIIFTLGGIAAALLIFGGGVAIGYQKAIFSSDWGRNYERNFSGPPAGPPGMMGMGAMAPRGPNAHGVAGEVIDVTSSSISVKDADNDERSIAITSGTVIRDMDRTVLVGQIAPGSRIIVIGAPNSGGQVEARFVRVFPQ